MPELSVKIIVTAAIEVCPFFAQAFDEQPHLQLLKEMLTQAFATPKRHPKSKPFLDHVINFSVAEGRIWLRNYQVLRAAVPHTLPHAPYHCSCLVFAARLASYLWAACRLHPVVLLYGHKVPQLSEG